MHGIVYEPDANGGPGLPKFELDGSWLNLVWQQVMNQAGQAAFSLVRTNPLFHEITWNADHIGIFRESSAGVAQVFAGKLWKPSTGPRDIICYCQDYMAYTAKSRCGWGVQYPLKKIGTEVIAPEWDLAKNADHSLFAFVATGTIQNPLAVNGVTEMTTNSYFGVALQNRLLLFYTLCESAMANTGNVVIWEITRTAPFTFNFWANRSTQRTNWASTYPGNLADFVGDLTSGPEANDLATPLDDGSGEQYSPYTLTDDASIAIYRRLQEAVGLTSLVGTTVGGPETDQAQASLARLLNEKLRSIGMLTEYPAQGAIDPFIGWNLGDLNRSSYQKGDRSGDLYDGYLLDVGVAATWSPSNGERQIIYRRSMP